MAGATFALVRETKNDEQRTLPLAGKALDALRELKLKDSTRGEWVFAQPSGLPGPFEHFDAHWHATLEHKTLAMVKRYSHLVVDHKAKVIEKMIAAMGL